MSRVGAPSRKLRIRIEVNGSSSESVIPANYTLAEFLREEMNLTGTKLGCNRGECGACTVLLNGRPVFSCTMLAAEADGMSVETVEGVSARDESRHLLTALLERDGLQCGFCTPGMVISIKALLDSNPYPTLEEVRSAIAGNFCRCGAYLNIFESVLGATRGQEGSR